MQDIKIIYKNIDELVPYENNPRDNTAAIDAVAASIKEFGFKNPIIIDSDNVIVAGHTRLKAAQKLKIQNVPCVVADDLTQEQVNAFRLADNKTAELAEWDLELLNSELELIDDIDMTEFGFELDLEDEQEVVEDEFDEDEFDEELPEEPQTKLGDIYQLGRHRLSCGDSTDPQHIKKLLDGALVDTVYTDPPYGMKKEKDGVQNDNLNYDDLLEFNKKWVPITFDAMKDVGSWYCWGIDEPLMDLYSNILRPMKKQNKITFRNLLTWDKGSGQGQLSSLTRMYPTADEKCLFVMKGVQGFNNNSDNYYEGFDEIRLKLVAEAERVGLTPKKLKEITGVAMYAHWFTKSQWVLIPEHHFRALADYYGDEWTLDFEEDIHKQYRCIKYKHDQIKQKYYDTRAYFDATHENFNNVLHFERTAGEEREQAGGTQHQNRWPWSLLC